MCVGVCDLINMEQMVKTECVKRLRRRHHVTPLPLTFSVCSVGNEEEEDDEDEMETEGAEKPSTINFDPSLPTSHAVRSLTPHTLRSSTNINPVLYTGRNAAQTEVIINSSNYSCGRLSRHAAAISDFLGNMVSGGVSDDVFSLICPFPIPTLARCLLPLPCDSHHSRRLSLGLPRVP